MRRLAPLLVVVLLSACAVAGVPPRTPGPPTGPAADRPAAERDIPRTQPGVIRSFDEVRGLWVVRTSLKTPESVRAMVAEAWAGGFNTLVVQVRGRGDAFYLSSWEPPGEQLVGAPQDFDPLALAIEEAHARGMAVHAWVNTHLVWSGPDLPTSPDHIVNARPEWLAVPRPLARELHDADPRDTAFVAALRSYAFENHERVEGVYTSPAHPAVRARVYDIWMDLASRYDLDGIHFDYVRFPSLDFDYSRGALERFRSWVAPRLDEDRLRALDAEARTDPLVYPDSLPAEWDEFRRAQITQLVEAVYHGVKARRPELLVSAAVFADQGDAFRNRFQDWPRWVREGIVDVVVPMAYTPDDDTFRDRVRDAVRAAGRRERIWAGIGIYLQDSLESSVGQIAISRGEGAGGLLLFSYDWARDEGGVESGMPFLERLGRAVFIPRR